MTEPIPLDVNSAVFQSAEFTLKYAVTGPVVPMMYGSTDIVPETASVHLRYTPEGGVMPLSVLLTGPRAKKDGTPGLLHHSTHFSMSSRHDREKCPDWLMDVVGEAQSEVERWLA